MILKMHNPIFLYSFRVAAIDHGLFSFTDVKHASWPIILVTNPKHALFAMKHHEPLHLIQESTHIRFVHTWRALHLIFIFKFLTEYSIDQFFISIHMMEALTKCCK